MAGFSNGYEWDSWSSIWCATCVKDVNEDCPVILDILFSEKTPDALIDSRPGSLNRYDCKEFESID